jgi:hypothetical protein
MGGRILKNKRNKFWIKILLLLKGEEKRKVLLVKSMG